MSLRAVAGAVLVAGAVMWLVISWPPSEPESAPPYIAGAPSLDAPPPPPAAAAVEPAPPAQAALRVAEPTAPEDLKAAPSAAAPTAPADPIDGDRGPVAEYRKQYESEARDSAAQSVETQIRGAFAHSRTPDLFQSASCRKSICKVLMRWSPERQTDYIMSVRWLGVGGSRSPRTAPGFEVALALSPVSPKDAQGTRLVELFLKRREPTSAPIAEH